MITEATLLLLSPGGPSYDDEQYPARRACARAAWGGAKVVARRHADAAPGADGTIVPAPQGRANSSITRPDGVLGVFPRCIPGPPSARDGLRPRLP